MSIPLLQTGPGGSYVTSYVPRGNRLLALRSQEFTDEGLSDGSERRGHRYGSAPQPSPRTTPALFSVGPETLLDRLVGIDRVSTRVRSAVPSLQPASGQAHLMNAASRWLAGQIHALHRLHTSLSALSTLSTLSTRSTWRPLAAAAVSTPLTAGSQPTVGLNPAGLNPAAGLGAVEFLGSFKA